MTVFLQQLGRGLRLCEGKQYLTVLDFIGNYRNAHYKLPLLAGQDLAQELDPAKALARLVRWQQEGVRPADIPEGVTVELEPVALDALRKALRAAAPLRELVLADLCTIAEQLGRPPTLLEWARSGRYSLATTAKSLGVDRWNRVLQAASLFGPDDAALELAAGEFLREVERTSMTKSFKMVVLLAMCEGDVFAPVIALDALVRFFRSYFSEERHRGDILGTAVEDVESVGASKMKSYLRDNPINAWIGGNSNAATPYFSWNDRTDELRYIGPSPGYTPAAFGDFAIAVRDRALARLHDYWRRPGPGRFVYPVIPTGNVPRDAERVGSRSFCVMFGENREGLPRGWHLVLVNGRYLYGKFVKLALNVVKVEATDAISVPNVLTQELEALFGGTVPSRARVRLVRRPGAQVWEIIAA